MSGNDFNFLSNPFINFTSDSRLLGSRPTFLLQAVPQNTITGIGTTVIYRLRGWDPSISQYEIWFGTTRTTSNPSTRPLLAIEVESESDQLI